VLRNIKGLNMKKQFVIIGIIAILFGIELMEKADVNWESCLEREETEKY